MLRILKRSTETEQFTTKLQILGRDTATEYKITKEMIRPFQFDVDWEFWKSKKKCDEENDFVVLSRKKFKI